MNEAAHGTPQIVLSPTEVRRDRLDTLDTLRAGGEYVVGPSDELYPTEDIGQPSDLLGGGKLRVVAELAIPADGKYPSPVEEQGGSSPVKYEYDFMAVVSAKAPDGRVCYTVAGLVADPESGKMKMAPVAQAARRWITPADPKLVIGRSVSADTAGAQSLWGPEGRYSDGVSRRHVELELRQDGGVAIRPLGANGTWGEFGERPSESHDPVVSGVMELSSEKSRPSAELRFQDVEKDPAFVEVVQPFNAQLRAIEDKWKAQLSRAQINLQHATSEEARRSAQATLDATRTQIKAEQQPIRDGLQEAVKPYLRQRQELFRGDDRAGYMHDGQATYDRARRSVVSSGNKIISRIGNFTRNGQPIWFDSADGVRLGQLMPPARSTNHPTWAGNHSASKHNEYDNSHQSSAENVIKIAAAMVARNYVGSDQPIRIRPARNQPTHRLPGGPGEFNVYEVVEGLHRVQALRLVHGVDHVLSGAERHDHLR